MAITAAFLVIGTGTVYRSLIVVSRRRASDDADERALSSIVSGATLATQPAHRLPVLLADLFATRRGILVVAARRVVSGAVVAAFLKEEPRSRRPVDRAIQETLVHES